MTKEITINNEISSGDTVRLSNFILYLPTVNLRNDQNPGFALACHLANYFKIPCIILAVVLDDQSLPSDMTRHLPKQHKNIVMTSRRLAFTLEALADASKQWSDHGAGVAIRVHAPKCRDPDYLTLSSRAKAVVMDEPFFHPFLSFTQKVEKCCFLHSVPCFRVDGCTTVPPCSVLSKAQHDDNDFIYYTGVPQKAWIWQQKTEHLRQEYINRS
jgi:hypothetical protein